MWISYPITAAGPQRICTVFPILPSQQQATREPKSDDENIAPCVDCQSFCEVAMRDHKWEYVRKKPSHGFSPISTDSIQQLRVSLTAPSVIPEDTRLDNRKERKKTKK